MSYVLNPSYVLNIPNVHLNIVIMILYSAYRCTGVDDDFVDPCFPILPIPERNQCIRFIRSAAVCQDNAYSLKPREQINVNTAFLDASMVYGSSEQVQTAVRNLTSKYLYRCYSL